MRQLPVLPTGTSWVLFGFAWFACVVAGRPDPVRGDEKPKKKPCLEFRIVANQEDDGSGIETAQKWFVEAKSDASRKAELQKLAEQGAAPPTPLLKGETVSRYQWVEIGSSALEAVDLDPKAEKDEKRNAFWKRAEKARTNGEAILATRPFDLDKRQVLVWSRPCQNLKFSKEERERRKYEVFVLTRVPEPSKIVTSEHLTKANVIEQQEPFPQVLLAFSLSKEGGDRMAE